MKGTYIPINDGTGIIGFSFKCPQCNHLNLFSSNESCDACDLEQSYEDPDEWYDMEMLKRTEDRAWNKTKTYNKGATQKEIE